MAAKVRAVITKVKSGMEKGGHAWVQLWQNAQYLPLEATFGPYWHDDQSELVTSRGTAFGYYAAHSYAVVEVWDCYNGIDHLNPRTRVADAPASWQA